MTQKESQTINYACNNQDCPSFGQFISKQIIVSENIKGNFK
jgi:hypothetical protein